MYPRRDTSCVGNEIIFVTEKSSHFQIITSCFFLITASFFLSMSFEVMNLTWHQELNDSQSAEFRQHEEQFCQKVRGRCQCVCVWACVHSARVSVCVETVICVRTCKQMM